MNLTIKKCDLSDLEALRDISEKTFHETFRTVCPEEGMKVYLKEAFSREQMLSELQNPGSEFYMVMKGDDVCGYMKLNEASAQKDICDEKSLEMQRIYICDGEQGKGLGTQLMSKALEIAGQKKKEYMWLGVWSGNDAALAFYRRYGFYEIGTYEFEVGGDLYSNVIMRKDFS